MNYPAQFDDEVRTLEAAAGGAVEELKSMGYEIKYGLTKPITDKIIELTKEPAIREYCPKDSSERFKNLDATERWLSKGRATFLLTNSEGQLVGYGWAGVGSSSHVPGGETTFAIRIGQKGQGQGLATPFAKAIVFGSAELFGSKNFWLETWQSNGGAVHVYHKIGFQDIDQQSDHRPTKDGGTVQDTRLYMSLPNELLS